MIWCHLPVCTAAYLIDEFLTEAEISLKIQVLELFLLLYNDQ